MPIEAARADNASRAYSIEPKDTTCSPEKAKSTSEPKASVLDAWDRMEASYSDGTYTPGADAVCSIPPEEPSEGAGLAPAAANDDSCECPTPEAPKPPPKPPETYEQCVNREAYEASKTGRWALTVTPTGPLGMGAACVAGGVGGYYSGGTAGATMGTTDGKVECDQPDRPGSPSAKALEEMNTVPFQGPIKR
ncbi:MAG: hypothetical protein ACOC1F_04095 [Myxococcota bacterium]